jgi:signal transduction histidine kinase
MSLSIRSKALLAAGLIFLLLLAPTVYSVLVLREISALTAMIAGRDTPASVRAAQTRDLFEQADRVALLQRPPYNADPLVPQAFERSLADMQRRLDYLDTTGDEPLPALAQRAASALRDFREKALAPEPDEADLKDSAIEVRRILNRLLGASRDVAQRRTKEAEALALRAASLTLASAVIGFITAAVLGAALWRSLNRPLRDLVAGTERIGRGQFDESIPVLADDELGRLAAAFNRMAGALGELERMKAEFLAAASHGLRTPLACVKGYLSSMKSGRQGAIGEESLRALDRMEEEVDRVTRFVDQLLDLGRLRAGRMPFAMREIPAAAFFTSIGRSFDAMAEQRSIIYKILVEEGFPARIVADPDRLGEALLNLLGNAFKYTPPGGTVALTVSGEDGWVRVEVADSGPGIPEEEVPLIFEKFYRGGGVAAEGTGLGLAIARGIVERHGGVIWAESERGHGARFIFRVPPHPPGTGLGRRLRDLAGAGVAPMGATVFLLCLLSLSGCRTAHPVVEPTVPQAPDPPPSTLEPAVSPPRAAPGDIELAEAGEALSRGDKAVAIRKLEGVVELGADAPGRVDALLALAVLRARPDDPARDTQAALALVERILQLHPGGAKEEEAKLLKSFLEVENMLSHSVEELRAQLTAAREEGEALRQSLAKREDELKKIKEILLGKTPGS